MKYDKENDKIVSAVGTNLEIYPVGPTFHEAVEIEIDTDEGSIIIPSDNIRELIDGLTQAAARIGV